MKGACFEGIEWVGLREVSDPVIEDPGDAIVRVSVAGLCGSDLHPYRGRETGLDLGTVMGHEMVGEVVELGPGVEGVEVGSRVCTPFSTSCGRCFYCQAGLTSRCDKAQLFGWVEGGVGLGGCQSEYVRVPQATGTLVSIPDDMSDIAALLLSDNFSTGFYCAEMAQIHPGGVYVVIGCGTVGLMGILAVLSMGADVVIAVDPIEERRAMASTLGATVFAPGAAVDEAVRMKTNGRGADGVMEVVGNAAAQSLAYDLLRPGGVMAVVGCHTEPAFAFSPSDAYDKNLTFRTGRCPARSYMDRLMDVVRNCQSELEPFVTHRFSVDDCTHAYEVFANRADGCLKAVFEF